jgi:hypothetical protein
MHSHGSPSSTTRGAAGRGHGLELSCSLRHGAANGPSVPWLEGAELHSSGTAVKHLRAVGSEIDSRNFRTTMCLKGFPSLEVSHRLLRVGFVGSRLPGDRKIYSASHQLAEAEAASRRTIRASQEARKQGDYRRHCRT